MNIIANEHSTFLCHKERTGDVTLSKKNFEALEELITENSDTMTKVMGISVKKGVGKVITSKNYVGVIALSSGDQIEILPKVNSETEGDPRKILFDMLNTLYAPSFEQFKTANIRVEETSVLEVFIKNYIEMVFSLVKSGLNSGYESICENENFLKGKLLFNEQIKFNYAHKERSYVEYDVFTANRPENRIIKSTLRLLHRISVSQKSKSELHTLLELFSEVEFSKNHRYDLSKIVSDRNYKRYDQILQWSSIFLDGESFTTFSGSRVSAALLFPMEKLFESYVAALIRRNADNSRYRVHIQDKRLFLFEHPKQFNLRPDIVIEDIQSGEKFIMDTKWKILSNKDSANGISQADMYQMYAYSKKYSAPSTTLIYPKAECDLKFDEYRSNDGVVVKIRFIDLYNAKSSIKELLSSIEPITT